MIKKYRQFLIYALKWQAGILVAVPSMYFFHDYLGWSNFATTIAFQFIGACVFWHIDKRIFKSINN